MKYVFVVLLALLCARVCWGERQPCSFDSLTPEEISWHGMLDMADKSDFIAVGTKHIKFAIHGGSVYVPSLDRVLTQRLAQEVKSAVGEEVLLFLCNNTDEGTEYFKKSPHGRHRVHMMTFGKRLIQDGKASFKYRKDTAAKSVEVPLELATTLNKSYLKDETPTLPLENEIKTVVQHSVGKAVLSAKISKELKKKSDKVINRTQT